MTTGKTVFLYGEWLRLPINIRHKIAADFGIKKKRSTHVSNDAVIDDGYVLQDIEEALSVMNMQHFLDTDESDTNVLWDYLVAEASLSDTEHALLAQCIKVEPALQITTRHMDDGRVFVGTNLFDGSGNREEFCLDTVEDALKMLLSELNDNGHPLSKEYPAPVYDTRFLSDADKATIKTDDDKAETPIIKEVKRRGRPTNHDKTNKQN